MVIETVSMLNMLQRSSRNTTRTWLPKSEPLPLARSRWQANIDHICLWIRSLKPSSNKPSSSLLTLSNIPWWINWEVQTALASSNLEGQEALVAYTTENKQLQTCFSRWDSAEQASPNLQSWRRLPLSKCWLSSSRRHSMTVCRGPRLVRCQIPFSPTQCWGHHFVASFGKPNKLHASNQAETSCQCCQNCSVCMSSRRFTWKSICWATTLDTPLAHNSILSVLAFCMGFGSFWDPARYR